MNEQTQDLDKRLSRLENMHIMGGIIVAVGLFFIIGSGYYIIKKS
jgi:hypothetical protein